MDTLPFPLDCKSIDDAGHIEGLAAAFGNVDHGGDRIVPGAFTKSLEGRASRPLPMLLHHDLKRPIGAWTELRETSAGLMVKGKITVATRAGAEAAELVRDGALSGLSIGYLPTRHALVGKVRELHQIDLHEASLVAVPMNNLSRVHTIKAITSPGDIREMFQETGMSSRQAKAAAGAAWKAFNDCPNEPDAADLAAILDASAARIAAL